MRRHFRALTIAILCLVSCDKSAQTRPVPDAGSSSVDTGVAKDSGPASPVPDASSLSADSRGPDASGAVSKGVLGLNDVSVLLPFPKAGERWLGPEAMGKKGVLLPRSIYSAVPALLVGTDGKPDETDFYLHLHVVAARFDACAPTGTPGPCRAELRLVFQPLEPNGGSFFVDAALHATYRISDSDVHAVAGALAAITSSAPESLVSQPLRVHPTIASQGLTGAAASAYRTLVLAYAGVDTLTRLTFTTVLGQRGWTFGGFDVGAAGVSKMKIGPSSTDTLQTIDASTSVTVKPSHSTDQPLQVFYDKSALGLLSTSDLASAVEKAVAIENPKLGGIDSLSCAACHLATQSATAAALERGVALDQVKNRFVSPFNLSRAATDVAVGLPFETPEDIRFRFFPVRAFGYHDGGGKAVGINQRVVNESAVAADAWNAILATL